MYSDSHMGYTRVIHHVTHTIGDALDSTKNSTMQLTEHNYPQTRQAGPNPNPNPNHTPIHRHDKQDPTVTLILTLTLTLLPSP